MDSFVLSESDPLRAAAESFVRRLRNGERPHLAEYVERLPEQANRIRELFPRLLASERRVGEDATTGPFGPVTDGLGIPTAIGDYLIVREIGRGGMGIVYEAVQASLGRQVALKVLPNGPFSRGHYLERFRREARAAARLHHTNIVPVFGVGDADGLHYYAMQYIEGMGIDAVLKEIRQRRGLSPQDDSQPTKTVNLMTRSDFGPAAVGDFQLGPASILPSGSDAGLDPSQLARGGNQLAELGGQCGLRYFRSVARLGVQAAEALAYAHDQGVLHRDIKPSNLLLDRCGTVWITDFGLAKAEGDDLTGTGEIFGTLRYMAPERFKGRSDARSDIYALGMTLYELLALRPAFEDEDRLRMIERISSDRPEPLSQAAPGCPHDLETIVLKAIHKDAGDRYESAAEMADDLRRFLADRPIRARRTTAWEELRRWCRRNPAITGLIGLVLAMWVALVAVTVRANFSLRAERDEVINAKQRAETAEAFANDRLWLSQVTTARLLRSLRSTGQRFASLDAIAEARRIRSDRTLVSDAAASLALPDVRRVNGWDGWPAGTVSVDLDPRFERYARADRDGSVSVRSAVSDSELFALPGLGGPARVSFSRTGQYLAVRHERDGRLLVWKLNDDGPLLVLDEPANVNAWAFGPDDRLVVSGRIDGGLLAYELPSGRLLQMMVAGPTVLGVDVHTDGIGVAVATGDDVAVLDLGTGRERHRHDVPGGVGRVSWQPGSHRLAAATGDGKVYLIRKPGEPDMIALEGHRGVQPELAFHPDGSVLVTSAADRTLRIWDTHTARLLMTASMSVERPRFSESGRYLAAEIEGNRINVLEIADGKERRTLVRRGRPAALRDGAIDPDGRLVAVATADGVSIWDLASGEELIQLPVGESTSVLFRPNGELLTSGVRGVFAWPVRPEGGGLRVGPPRLLAAIPGERLARCANGAVSAVATRIQGAVVLDADRPALRNPLLAHDQATFVSVSPDGRRIATGTQAGAMVRIWDAATNRLVTELPVAVGSMVEFSPDGGWLATNVDGAGINLWSTSDWRTVRLIPSARQSRCAFSHDGSTLATESEDGSIRLFNPYSGSELVTLQNPNGGMTTWLGFSPDDSRLVQVVSDDQAVRVWDLGKIRAGLRQTNLDWSVTPPPATPAAGQVGPMTAIGLELLDAVPQARWQVTLASLRVMTRPDRADGFVERGTALAELGFNALAVDDFSRALALQPDHAEASYLRGLEYFRMRLFEPALDDFTRAQSRPALVDVAGWMRGKALLQLDRVEEMMAAVNGLLAHYPNDPQLYYQRALGHSYRGRHAEAIADLELALKKGPSHDLAMNNLAWVLAAGPVAVRDPERALGLAQRAVRLAPNKGTYQNTLGVCLYRLGRYRESLSALEKSLAAGRGQFDGYDLFVMAMCLARLNEPARAADAYQKAVRWQKTTRLTAHELNELNGFRSEADALIAQP